MFGLTLVLLCLSTTPFVKDKGLERWILGGEISKSDSRVVLIVKLFVFGVEIVFVFVLVFVMSMVLKQTCTSSSLVV